jgi:hypothetical protein
MKKMNIPYTKTCPVQRTPDEYKAWNSLIKEVAHLKVSGDFAVFRLVLQHTRHGSESSLIL